MVVFLDFKSDEAKWYMDLLIIISHMLRIRHKITEVITKYLPEK